MYGQEVQALAGFPPLQSLKKQFNRNRSFKTAYLHKKYKKAQHTTKYTGNFMCIKAVSNLKEPI
ncbi:hypothetical protein IW16_26275 [Chryseobacterium vrystaatense]|uniref:Uncharacterized protein n=1 Tax=Chryseobacterium vrystaatense TaxID=307480 RepID=A0ABR4UGS5_9FLAO|nr:hypothetical protein IW16_26275 [Chryseobacterium vrystaatense]